MIRTPYPYYLIMHSHSIYRLDWLLEDSVAIIQQRKPGANLQEPDYTAAITTEFVHLVNNHPVLEHAKMGGSFIHQRPYVHFTLMRKKGVANWEICLSFAVKWWMANRGSMQH